MACVLIGTANLPAQDSKPTEYQVKAAYLYRFGRFVEWPAKATAVEGGRFTVCVLGQDPFGGALDATVAGEVIDRAKVVAERISKPEAAVTCRILFISSSEGSEPKLKEILGTLDKASVLTVSDMPQFARRGGMVQFLSDGKRVRFEVNLPAVERAGLNLSSELLKVAIRVNKTP